MQNFSSEKKYEHLYNNAERLLRFSGKGDFKNWQKSIYAKFKEILGAFPEKKTLKLKIEYKKENEYFKEVRYAFASDSYSFVPCHLLIPKNGIKPLPVIICLQGHTPGMHISLGRLKPDENKDKYKNDDYAIQAVKQGYAALVMELAGFGERLEKEADSIKRGVCYAPSMKALILGRTMTGERVRDVMRAIDSLEKFKDLDMKRVGCMGFSTGGVISYYTACLDNRINAVMPVCAVCLYKESIYKINHCACNYVPGILKYFEMPDLSGLIAPRKLLIIAGKNDDIFPIKGTKEAFKIIKKIYKTSGQESNCRLLICECGHEHCLAEAWQVFKEMTGW